MTTGINVIGQFRRIIVGGLIVLGIVGSIRGRLARFPILVFSVAAIGGLTVSISNNTVWGGIGAGFGVLVLFWMGRFSRRRQVK